MLGAFKKAGSRLASFAFIVGLGILGIPESVFEALRAGTSFADVLHALGLARAAMALSVLIWLLAPLAGPKVAKICTGIASAIWLVGAGIAIQSVLQSGLIDPNAIGRLAVENNLYLAIASLFGLVFWAIERWTRGAIRFWARAALAAIMTAGILLSPMLGSSMDLGWIAFCVCVIAIFAGVAIAYRRIDRAASISPQPPSP